jgi:hypothetical protein
MRTSLFLRAFGVLMLGCIGLAGCEKVYNGEQLSPRTVQRLRSLGLLHPHEKIYQFYTNASAKAAKAGNFYTTERLASYWLADDSRKTQLNSAYYRDIARIDTFYLPTALTYVSYMAVLKKDGTRFRVYVGGKKPVVSSFFEHAMAHWQAAACARN